MTETENLKFIPECDAYDRLWKVYIPHRHGTINAVYHGCCKQPCCRAARAAYAREYRHKNKLNVPLVDAEPTKEALNKLKDVLGTWTEVAALVGLERAGLAKVASGKVTRVKLTTEEKVYTILATLPSKEV